MTRGLVFRRITVDKISTRCVKNTAVFAFLATAERLAHLSVADIYSKVPALQAFDSGEDDFFAFGIEAEDVFYQPVAFGQLFHLVELAIGTTNRSGVSIGIHLSLCVEKIEVIVSVTLALVDKLGIIPRQEYNRILRLYIFGMSFFI